MDQLSDYDVTEAMLKYGGSFVQKLAELYRLADEYNQYKLFCAFQHYFKRYQEIALKGLLRKNP